MASESSVLRVQGVSLSFGDLAVLTEVDVNVDTRLTGIIGPNGAGKTTLFNVITGVLSPGVGRVEVLGTDVRGFSPNRIAALGVRRTFQTPKLVPRLTVFENVLLGLDGGARGASLLGEAFWWPSVARRERAKRKRARDLLAIMGLGLLERVRGENLPLPTQKLVEVARALISRPRLLLLDEPAAGMGGRDVQDLLGPVGRAVEEWDCHVVIIEHDMELVTELCEQVFVLDFGRMIARGPAAEVLASTAVMEAYLGAANVEG